MALSMFKRALLPTGVWEDVEIRYADAPGHAEDVCQVLAQSDHPFEIRKVLKLVKSSPRKTQLKMIQPAFIV